MAIMMLTAVKAIKRLLFFLIITQGYQANETVFGVLFFWRSPFLPYG